MMESKKYIDKIEKFVTKNGKWIVLFICIIGFLSLAEEVFHKETIEADIIGYKFISEHLISNFATPIAKFITNFGGATYLIIIAIMSVILIKNKKIGTSIVCNLCIASTLNYTLKNVLQRPRPNGLRIISESGYSFPSGHSMVSMAFYGFLVYLIYKYVKNKYIKWSLISILSVLIILIGGSRVYLGVHYVSDVIAGFLIAISYLVIYISVINKFVTIHGYYN